MTKVEGPEEFFEVFRTARKNKQGTAPADESRPEEPDVSGAAAGPAAPNLASEPGEESAWAPRPEGKAPESAAEAPASTAPRRFPLSVFADDEPTITMRRSTLIFAIIVVLVLLFIAYAVGAKRASRSNPSSRAASSVTGDGVRETRRPALPEWLRGKCVVFARDFDSTQDRSSANAQAYCRFLNTSNEAAFVRGDGKQAFLLSLGPDERKLVVCVGPFDGVTGPQVDQFLSRLRGLLYEGTARPFATASVVQLDQFPFARLVNNG